MFLWDKTNIFCLLIQRQFLNCWWWCTKWFSINLKTWSCKTYISFGTGIFEQLQEMQSFLWWTHKRVWLEARNYQVSSEKYCCPEAKLKYKGWLFGLGLGTKLTTWSYFQKVDVLAPSSHRWASPPSTAPEKASAFSKNDLKPQYCTWKCFAQLTIASPNAREKSSYLF